MKNEIRKSQEAYKYDEWNFDSNVWFHEVLLIIYLCSSDRQPHKDGQIFVPRGELCRTVPCDQF
jgi:hypothetical protein